MSLNRCNPEVEAESAKADPEKNEADEADKAVKTMECELTTGTCSKETKTCDGTCRCAGGFRLEANNKCSKRSIHINRIVLINSTTIFESQKNL